MLNDCYAISGSEEPIRQWLKKQLSAETVFTDRMGNLIAHKCGSGKKVILAVPMDEPGIIVTQITEDGYLKFETVGRFRPEFLAFKRVRINGIQGVIALKAIHLTSKEEREKPMKENQLFVDIGADSYEEASRVICIGDCGTVDSEYRRFGDRMLKGRAVGSRLACKVAAELLQKPCSADLTVVFSVQREIACRGLSAALCEFKADIGIALDGVPAIPGEGVILTEHTDFDIKNRMISLAKQKGIPVKSCVANEKGQETVLKQQGITTLALGIPVRYPESASQIASLDDAEALKQLLECYMEGLS